MVPTIFSLWRRPLAVGGKAGVAALLRGGILLAGFRHLCTAGPVASKFALFFQEYSI